MSDPATLELLIQIREELAGLHRTKQGLKDATTEAGKLGAVLRQGLGIGTGMDIARRGIDLLTATFRASIGEAFRLAEEIKDQSEALHISAEAYQVVKFELAQAGVEMGRFSMAVAEQTQSLAAARTGAGAAAEAYKALGLSAAELEQLSPEQRVLAVARAVLLATDQTKAFQAAGTVLGTRGLPQLLNSLRTLATEGLDKVAAAGKEAGRIMGEDLVERLDAAKKVIDNFNRVTLPVAAGTAIGWAQGAMDWVGATTARAVNWWEGLPQVSRFDVPPRRPAPAPVNGVSPATDEARLMALIEATEQRQAAINDGLFTEAERRRALIPILEQQYEWTEMLLDVKFGGQARIDPTRADVTEAELAQYKERNALEAKLAALRRARMQQVDTPLTALNRELLDTTGLLQQSLAGGVNNAIASLGSNIWGAVKGTNSFGDAWRGVGNIVGQVLTDIMVKLMIVRPLLSAFGIGDAAPVGVITPGTPTVTGAGGGTFLTHGPTHLTVGDNPGGVELVQVTPLSGIGESTINGMALRMAGGGAALTAPGATRGGGDTFHFSYQFSGGVSREEILGLLPAIVESSKAGVLEAQRRRRGGHR